MSENEKEISYLLLYNEYLKRYNISLNHTKEDVILKKKVFPINWNLEYGIDKKISLLECALKNNITLKEAEKILINQNKRDLDVWKNIVYK